jgi:hypothetical protein
MPPKPASKAEKIPDGWYSREQLESAWGLSMSHTGNLLTIALKRKEAKVRKFKVQRPTGVYWVPYYKFRD